MHAPDISAFWQHFEAQMDQIFCHTAPTPAWIAANIDQVVGGSGIIDQVVGSSANIDQVVGGSSNIDQVVGGSANIGQVVGGSGTCSSSRPGSSSSGDPIRPRFSAAGPGDIILNEPHTSEIERLPESIFQSTKIGQKSA